MLPALKLYRFAFLLERKADQALQEKLGLSFSQCMILRSLRLNPECSQQCIAKCRDLTQAAVSRQVDALKAKKLIARRENEKNRREHMLSMTAKGAAALDEALKIMQRTFDAAFKPVAAGDREQLEKTLDLLLEDICDECGGKDKPKK